MATHDHPSTSHRLFEPSRIKAQSLGLLLVALMAGFCLVSVSMLRTMHQQAWTDGVRTSENLLEAQSGEIDRTLTIYDTLLQSASASLTDDARFVATPELRRLAIFNHVQDRPDLGPIRILGVNAAVLYDSSTPDPLPASMAEREALAVHLLRNGDSAALSAPFRTSARAFAITLSHRISAGDGHLIGVAVGTINLRLFFKQMQNLRLGPDDAVALFSSDGSVLANMPTNRFAGRSIAGSAILRRFMAAPSGSFEAPARLDGIHRLFSFKHLGNWPLILDTGLSTEYLYRPWRHRIFVIGLLVGSMVVFTLVLLSMLRRDFKERVRAARVLATSEARYRLLAESASDMIVRVDRNLVRTYVSPSCRNFGYEPEDLVGLASHTLIHEEDSAAARQILMRTVEEQVEGELVYRLRHKSGRYTWVESHVSPVEEGGYLAVTRDIDKRKQDEQKREESQQALAHLAATDGLTKLANRRIFDESLLKGWHDAARAGKPLSLLMMDVDHFKAYNDHYGHQAGDNVLVKVAQQISRQVKRASDTTARYGGEEFAVLLPTTDLYGAIEVAESIRKALWDADLEHALSSQERLTISIGVATAMPSLGGSSPEALIKAADDELYRGKQGGRNRVYARALASELETQQIADG